MTPATKQSTGEVPMQRYSAVVMALALSVALSGHARAGNPRHQPTSRNMGSVQWVTPAVSAPHVEHHIFHSDAARADVSYHIYVPPAYHSLTDQNFAVLYWLHGSGGGLKGIPRLAKYFNAAIEGGSMPPVLIVFANGMPSSMWTNSKDGTVPMETVVARDLVQHIDANFRTISSRECRLIQGFSMGGFGAARLYLKYHHIFGAASMLGAGPLQQKFLPEIGPKKNARARQEILKTVYGGDQEYFRAQSPWFLAEQIPPAMRHSLQISMAIGDQDQTLEFNEDFDAHLTQIGIPHSFTVVPGIAHKPMGLLTALGQNQWDFYSSFFHDCDPIP